MAAKRTMQYSAIHCRIDERGVIILSDGVESIFNENMR